MRILAHVDQPLTHTTPRHDLDAPISPPRYLQQKGSLTTRKCTRERTNRNRSPKRVLTLSIRKPNHRTDSLGSVDRLLTYPILNKKTDVSFLNEDGTGIYLGPQFETTREPREEQATVG